MNAWESVFLQSPVNDGCYEEDDLPQLNWEWPKKTWFQTRLDYVRDHKPKWEWPKETWFQTRLDYVHDHEPKRSLKSHRRLDRQEGKEAA